jgi:Tfp pilus assembly protein PilF
MMNLASHLLEAAMEAAMRRLATVIFSVLLVAGLASAQSDLRSGPYILEGLIITPHSSPDSEFEVRLINDGGVLVASVLTHTQEHFYFRGLPGGVYYVEADIGGFKPVRQRVDFNGTARETSLPITLEEAPVASGASHGMTDDNDVVSVSELSRSPQLMKQLQEATKKLQNGDFNGARTRLEAILTTAPDLYDAHKYLGTAYQQGHRFDDAEKQFELARGLRPQSAAPLIHLGSLYLDEIESGTVTKTPQTDVLDKARRVLLRAIELSPGVAFARYLLGVAYYKSGSYSDAESSLIRALDLDPHLGSIRLALANVYIRVQDWSKALSNLDTYLKDNPRCADREHIVETRARIERIANAGN